MFELLFGYTEPISALECRLWTAFWNVKNEYQEAADKKASKGGSDSSVPKMLGQSE